MSLILDALKKIDREKSSRRNRTANIAVEILRPDRPRLRRRTSLYLGAVFLTVVVTAAVTYAVMMKFAFLSKSSVPASVTSPASSQQAALATPESAPPVKPPPPASVTPPEPSQRAAQATPESALPVKPPPPASVTSPASSQQAALATPESALPVKPSPPASMTSPEPRQQAAPASLSREPVRDAQDQPSREPPKIQPHAGSKSPATFLDKKGPSQNIIQEEGGFAHGIEKKPVEQPPGAPFPARPSLKISGIMWSEESSERRAVINGTFTTEGSVIQGVKVLQINPTSVRFSHQGQPFEISVFE